MKHTGASFLFGAKGNESLCKGLVCALMKRERQP